MSLVRWVLGSLTRHWDLLWQMVTTDLRGRFVGSSLGLFWTVVHPIVTITIYIVVFSQVMGARLPDTSDRHGYALYLCAGLLPWIAFQEVVVRLTTIFPDNGNLVRKLAFPKMLLFGYVTLSSAITLAIALGVFVLAVLMTGHAVGAMLLWWMPFLALQLAFGLGLGMITSVLHVFVRDTAQFVAIAFQLAFWATPIVYVESILPPWLQALQRWNPLAAFSRSHRDIVLLGTAPDGTRTLCLVGLTAVTLATGTILYRRFRADILDEL